MDRRIKRTRNAVFNAVLELIIEKDTCKITVLELCKKADINKSTFYLHYKSMDDCVQSCLQMIMDEVVEFSKRINYNDIRNNPEKGVAIFLDDIEKRLDFLTKLKSSHNCANAIRMLKENLVNRIAKSNGFTIENNYYEISMITFGVAGCIDAVMGPLPVFKKDELLKVICSMIQAHSN